MSEKPTIEEIEDAIPEERKNPSFGDEGEGIIDVMERWEIDDHERGAHDGDHPTCPKCNDE